jgi:hypothetical protein
MKKGSKYTAEQRKNLSRVMRGKRLLKPEGFGERVSAGLLAYNQNLTENEKKVRYAEVNSLSNLRPLWKADNLSRKFQ